jgi:hypothetical protein
MTRATILNDFVIALANYDSITASGQGAIAMFRPFGNAIRPIGNNPPTLQEQHRRIFGNNNPTYQERPASLDSPNIAVLRAIPETLTF